MATKPKPNPADANKDGTVTKREQAAYDKAKAAEAKAKEKPKPGKDEQDKLSQSQLEKMFGFAKDVIWQNRELRQLYQDAIREQWTPDMFQSKFRSSNWYNNNAEFARTAWAAERTGGADWDAQMQEANLKIQDAATRIGAKLTPDQKATLARRYIYEGWGDPNRTRLMEQELALTIGGAEGEFLKGAAGNLQQTLAETARRNGVKLSQGYFDSAAQSVAGGFTTADDWSREIRQQAASKWPGFSDKIMSGIDMEDLASGYINEMAEAWEIDKDLITLDDPFIREALQGIDEKGNPRMESLWDFEYRLKSDPRWLKTKNGANDTASVGMNILRLMGFQS